MADCIFCKIVTGELPATKIDEDDRTLTFLDISPLREGHTLVIPKTHSAKLSQLSDDDAAALMRTAKRVTPIVTSTVDAQDATLAIHDGPAAGQEIEHLHLHIIPRDARDGGGTIHDTFRQRPRVEHEELEALGMEMSRRLGR